MSLQKKLLQAGLMSKKQARKINQESKNKRKKEKGNRNKKRHRLAAESARQAAEKEAAQRARIESRRASESIQLRRARALQIHHLLSHHQISYRPGNEVYWHYSADRQSLHKLNLPQSLVHALQQGALSIAIKGAMDDFNPNYVLIPREVAERIAEHAPERILSVAN